ncbi:PREDICTED: translin-associated factor X-interacting protein 1-like isoform X2 [Papilio xuthus]|uniref:Translin-associated factor X-interacting protein 1-like isoform X2 n=1 Tax=Papilio xuthus TaxID=66420 RepID=A0AAJ6Z116_PAPXU|nr:PREDICTED: translin-associated factor X-interacting protein 1-like isoform X2 [Papilio xuthus]
MISMYNKIIFSVGTNVALGQLVLNYICYILQIIFGISLTKKEKADEVKMLSNENAQLKNFNFKLNSDMMSLKKRIFELQQEKFSEYVRLMRERDGRYSLYHQKLQLEERVKQLTDSAAGGRHEDPLLLRVALDRCREQLAAAQRELARLADECADTVPRRDYDALEARERHLRKELRQTGKEYRALETCYNRTQAQKNSLQEELEEVKERCRELERAGTPRPHWELCADFIGGGRERWRQLTRGLSSRDVLVVLLRELGPAADTDHLEYFDGLGTDPAVPPYLRYSGRVRNLRLSRRELSVVISDVWRSKAQRARHTPLQDYLAHYFEERYQQAAVRAEWAYNVCAAAEQALDEPQVRVFWGVLRGRLSEDLYWAHRDQCQTLKTALYRRSGDGESITLEEFEKVAKVTFPLKSEVDIKNLSNVVRKQLKMKINQNLINLDKLFFENEEGFDRLEFARELFRQRQQAQEKYVRELAAELAGEGAAHMVGVDSLKRAFALLDPAIDHVRMERNIRWAFSDQTSALDNLAPRPLRAVLARLAAGHIERVGPRARARPRPRPRPRHKAGPAQRRTFYKYSSRL